MAASQARAITETDRETLRGLLAELEKLHEKHRREVRYVELKTQDPELREALVEGLVASHHHRLVPYLQKVQALKNRT